MAFFDCQIVQGGGGLILLVTCDPFYAGATITATDGETTLQATCPSSSPYTVEFKIPNSGSWTISGTVSGQTGSITVVIPDSATLIPPIPTGSTVTPVNDIQIWLHCANIWNKNYTTITQVLADASTLQALIASNNAADYMARSTSWASSVTANSNAMTYIGANNYCANKLLANSTWSNAIVNSTYFESVLTTKVPTMTSNTTPSGEAISGGIDTGYPNYYAFDGNDSTSFASSQTQSNFSSGYIGYLFTNSICVKRVKGIMNVVTSLSSTSIVVAIEASNDGTNWTTLKDAITINFSGAAGTEMRTNIDISVNNTSYYRRYRVRGVSANSNVRLRSNTLQFYGRAA